MIRVTGFIFVALICAGSINQAWANSTVQEIIDKTKGKIEGSIQDMETNELRGPSGYQGTNVRGSDMSLTQAEGEGTLNRETGDNTALADQGKNTIQNCQKDHCEIGSVFGTKATLKRKENLDQHGFAKDENGMPLSNKAYLDKALNQVKNAKNEFDYLKGEYADCNETSETKISKSQDSCDQYNASQINSCYPEQVVEIDAKYSYLCHKTRESRLKTCRDVITSIKCQESKECDMGGIERGSVESDMRFEYRDGVLTIGTIADNYWGGHCAAFDRTTTFKITNKDKIKEFLMFNVGYDDYMQITLNGSQIFIGPYGGNKLEVRGRRVDNGAGRHKCDLGKDWNTNPNVDLRPYLLEGENVLKIRVIVAGGGEGWLQIRAKQNCCSNWDIKREEKCDFS